METVILLAEDEKKLRDMIALHLEQEGYKVVPAADGAEALHYWREIKPDLLVLDLMLPGLSGWEVLKKIRQKHDTPVIILTARADEIDKLLGLELGADDYMTKPFSPRELSARIKAVLRRSRPQEQSTLVSYHDLRLDPERMEAFIGDTLMQLTASEFKILVLLAGNPGQVFSRLYILERIFGDMYEGYERTVDTHISNIRHKMEAAAASQVSIKTVYGIGYKLTSGE
ncbi:MAG: response regulator transcription factor [Syntrophomonadaceae bacterium]|nr:response regulator transcription factor [Syntrophomonadaceae bacterium]